MIATADFKKNVKILVDGQPYVITDFQHVKPGKGNQFTRTKMRNLLTGSNLERTFKSGEKFEVPNVATKDMRYLYKDENGYNFMDANSYEQIFIQESEIGDAKNYLLENMETVILFYNDRAIGVDVPNAVNLKVVQTDPGFKGNTVTGTTKPATLETGYIVQVPLHIGTGDTLRIDTRTGDYVERVNK